jgi:hypothetical protein
MKHFMKVVNKKAAYPPLGLLTVASMLPAHWEKKLADLNIAPLKEEEKQLAAGKNPYERKKGDSDAVAAWRERMGTAAAKPIYRLRCQTAEWVNALCRNRGFRQMPVRGRPQCRTVAVLYAIAHDIVQGMQLRAEVAMNTE